MTPTPTMTEYAADYARVIRYGPNEARAATEGTRTSAEVSALAHHAANGDDTALRALADNLSENDHPLGDLVQRAATGEGEGDYMQHLRFQNGATRDRTSMYPTTYAGADDVLGKGYVHARYYHTPTGHFFHLAVHPNDSFDLDRHPRSFILPTTEAGVRHHIDRLRWMGDHDEADEHEHALNTKPTAD